MDLEAKLRRAQGAKLKEAREAAGFRSARAAALEPKPRGELWPESTYRAHENGNRTIGQDDAERYARFLSDTVGADSGFGPKRFRF